MGRAVVRVLKNLDEILGMCLMAFIILLACANVFMRYVMGSPWGWVEEVTIFTFVWLTMIGAAAVVKAEGHCSIDVIVRKLSPGPRKAMNIFAGLITITTLLLLTWYGLELALSAGSKVTPILGIPYTYVDLAIPVGCGLMLIHYLEIIWQEIKGENKYS